MKKAKILSLLLAAVMLLSLIPAVGLTATAEELQDATGKPNYLPNPSSTEGVYKAGHNAGLFYYNTSAGETDETLGKLNATDAGALPASTFGAAIAGNTTTVYTGADATNTENGSLTTTTTLVPKNASGLLVKVKTTSTGGNNGIHIYPNLYSSTTIGAQTFTLTTASSDGKYGYYWDSVNQNWRATPAEWGFRVPDNFDGYLYIPFETYRMNYSANTNNAGSMFSSQLAWGMYIKTIGYGKNWNAATVTVSSIELVTVSTLTETQPTTLPDLGGTGINVMGYGYDGTTYPAYGNLSASGSFPNKMGSTSLPKLTNTAVTAAEGHVLPESTQGEAFSKINIFESTDGEAFATANGGSSTNGTAIVSGLNINVPNNAKGFLVKYRAEGAESNPDNCSVTLNPVFDGIKLRTHQTHGAYYYLWTGTTWVASTLEWASRVPNGLTTYIYIPFETYMVTEATYMEAAAGDPGFTTDKAITMTLTGFEASGAHWSGGTTGKVYSIDIVTVGNALTSASITVSNSLNLNVYAALNDATATLNVTPVNTELADKAQTGITGTKQADGTYKFTYKNILPQLMGEKFKVELVSGGKVVDSGEFSVREYCETLLNDANSAADLKALVVDILKYGAAAQNYADYNTTDLATKNLNTTQLALGAAVSNKVGTDATLTPATAATQFTSATLRLQDAVALRLNITSAEAAANVSVTVTLGSKSQTYTGATLTATDGGYTVLFTNISATEYAETITATVSVNGALTQTLTYSVNTYLANVNATAGSELGALVDAIYAYGVSASAYAGN